MEEDIKNKLNSMLYTFEEPKFDYSGVERKKFFEADKNPIFSSKILCKML